MTLREDADRIVRASIRAVQPEAAVQRALEGFSCAGRIVLAAIGKAAWPMADAAWRAMGDKICAGIVVTKYHHSRGPIGPLRIFEAGHPLPDENSVRAAREVLRLTEGLTERDCVLFLVSGGGSALFESPLVPLAELEDVTQQLLACGADIVEINTLRKRLSAVKGGKFAQHAAPARVYSVVLSDILGDPLDMIASGPAYPDSSTAEQARAVVKKYGLKLSAAALELLDRETPKQLDNVTTRITGSVRQLCTAASETCQTLGYTPVVLTASLACEAREAGAFLGAVAQYHQDSARSLAFIAGGETVVHLTGTGKGGRNQEIALAGAKLLDGLTGTALFSLGSDGTDGPTDAAGGIVTGETAGTLREAGVDIDRVLKDNDAYHALAKADGLIFTGPTGTNVNDLTVLLIRR